MGSQVFAGLSLQHSVQDRIYRHYNAQAARLIGFLVENDGAAKAVAVGIHKEGPLRNQQGTASLIWTAQSWQCNPAMAGKLVFSSKRRLVWSSILTHSEWTDLELKF